MVFVLTFAGRLGVMVVCMVLFGVPAFAVVIACFGGLVAALGFVFQVGWVAYLLLCGSLGGFVVWRYGLVVS